MSGVQKCPKCGGELEEGVMEAKGVIWDKEDVTEYWTSMWWLSGKYKLRSQAWRCKNCQLAIFYYGKSQGVKP